MAEEKKKGRTPLLIKLTDRALIEAIEAADGNLSLASRRLKVSHPTVHKELRRRGLDDLPAQVVARRRAARRRETRAALEAHDGCLSAAAVDLGITPNSVFTRIRSLGLLDYANALRPAQLSETEQRARLRRLLRKHDGVVHRVAKELGISRNTLRAWLVRHGLDAEGESLRIEGNKIGPRPRFGARYNRDERRAKLIAFMHSVHWSAPRAAKSLGVSVGTIYNRFHDLDIVPEEERLRDLLPPLIAALEESEGVVLLAAKMLYVDERTVKRWARELNVNIDDYRTSDWIKTHRSVIGRKWLKR